MTEYHPGWYTVQWAGGEIETTEGVFGVASGAPRKRVALPNVAPDPLTPDMQLSVRMLSGEVVTVDCAAGDQLITVKAMIERRVDVPRAQQRLFRPNDATVLADTATLRESGIETGAMLHLTVDASVRPGKAAVLLGAMSNVASDFPVCRFVFSMLTWILLFLHISFVSRNCCAVTGLAWQRGVNNGFCVCAQLGHQCGEFDVEHSDDIDEITSHRHSPCCEFGTCYRLSPGVGPARNHSRVCQVADASELDEPARSPDCECCTKAQHTRPSDGTTMDGDFDTAGPTINMTFAFFVITWFISLMIDLNCGGVQSKCDTHKRGALVGSLCRRSQQVHDTDRHLGASKLKQATRHACDRVPTLTMHNECSHNVRRGKHTHKVVTHTARHSYKIEMKSELAAPLDVMAKGGGWEIPYFSPSGEPRVASSRRGLLELRVTLEVSWASAGEKAEFEQVFEQFQHDNHRDCIVKNWITLDFEDVERRALWELEDGVTPAGLNVSCFLLASFLSLGWLYQMWYDSLTSVVELHLEKTIAKKGPFVRMEQGDRRRQAEETAAAEAKRVSEDFRMSKFYVAPIPARSNSV